MQYIIVLLPVRNGERERILMDDNTRNVWEWGLFMMPCILFGIASIIHAWRKPREEDEK